MKIRIQSGEKKFTVPFPTCLVFSRGSAWIANHIGRRYAGDAMKEIPPEAMDALFAEFRRIKSKHGSWELVNVQSADGDIVKITL